MLFISGKKYHIQIYHFKVQLKSKYPCCGLKENVLHTVIYWNVWTTVGGDIWEGLGGAVLLKEICY